MESQTSVLKDEDRTRCEVWSRVMGYHRPVSFWNPGKQSEHKERRFFVTGSHSGTAQRHG
ncbi:anaerobic ribonucleoside-triphosphate reductase [Microbulbifer sp. GL-2]|uniref:anaerobic ribonucleoside-triphosphate reductase n=1 Tax=Microbulbifer sp. GL-2 TaxID=2591606 RepID=UPI001162BE40|nr:anaerobic ribonucleoside-triphosphate reductase [Microbulbifer sp. GL-2]BBM03483.1 hypothetical protein GL2_35570 [Microbulbifer sp. GL-2]